MAEDNYKTSSQESLPLSQETYHFLLQQVRNQIPDITDGVEIIDLHNPQADLPTEMANMDFMVSNPNSCFMEKIADISNIEAQFSTEEQLNTFQGCNVIQVSGNHLTAFSEQVNQKRPPSILPAYLIENYEGEYTFEVSFKSEEQTKKPKWIYSKENNKLYIQKSVSCPVNFSTKHPVPNDAYIRSKAVFISPNDASELVHRCLNHSQAEIENGVPEAMHLIRCENEFACYETDSHTNSVVVPYQNPAVGQKFSCYLYKFMCYTSCSGGPNRRPLMVIFTLERRGEVIGRQKVNLKICACPTRDLMSDEKHIENSKVQVKRSYNDITDRNSLKIVKKSKSEAKKENEENESYFTIKVKDENCYEFLRKMKRYYGIYCAVKKKTSDFKCLIYSSTSEEEKP